MVIMMIQETSLWKVTKVRIESPKTRKPLPFVLELGSATFEFYV